MTRVSGSAGRRPVAMLVGVLALATVPLMAVSAVAVESRTLVLDPEDGPPGTSVTWVAAGFEDCLPVDDADPHKIVALTWDGVVEIGRAEVSDLDGSAESTFAVPESAPLAQHRVLARCTSDGTQTAEHPFKVTSPKVVQVVVPNVIGKELGPAARTLEGKGLALGDKTGTGPTVIDQFPPAGSLADRGKAVDVVLGTAKPELVEVPTLRDRSADEAKSILESADLGLGSISGDREGVVLSSTPAAGQLVPHGTAVNLTLVAAPSQLVRVPNLVGLRQRRVQPRLASRDLKLGLVSGRGRVVRSQTPRAGSRVPVGSAVNISVQPGVRPRQLVAVPDLVGQTPVQALSTAMAAGLLLGGNLDNDAKISSQQPAAGTLVPAGSTVTVAFDRSVPWRRIVSTLVVLLGAAAGGYQLLRRELDRRWIRRHVRVTSRVVAGALIMTESTQDASGPTHVVRMEPHADSGTQVLEEVES